MMMMMENWKMEADAIKKPKKELADFILQLLHHGADLFKSRDAFAEDLRPHITATGPGKWRLDSRYSTYVINDLSCLFLLILLLLFLHAPASTCTLVYIYIYSKVAVSPIEKNKDDLPWFRINWQILYNNLALREFNFSPLATGRRILTISTSPSFWDHATEGEVIVIDGTAQTSGISLSPMHGTFFFFFFFFFVYWISQCSFFQKSKYN